MILALLAALLLGVSAGTLTGLLPGIHMNLIGAFLVSMSVSLSFLSPVPIIVFVVSMTITHTFLDFIPSIFLGAPDESSALSVLPGHKMLLKGKAQEAVFLTLIGSSLSIFLILLLSLPFIFYLPLIYNYIKIIIPFLLILVSLFMIYSDNNKFNAFLLFCLAGFLGISTLSLPLSQPLLPLLTGLFGGSSLITSLTKKTKIPKQKTIKIRKMKIKLKSILKTALGTLIASPFCTILPGLGASQAAIIGKEVTGKTNEKEFLILLGSINTIIAGVSFLTLYSINRARTGTALALSQIIEFQPSFILIILTSIILSGILSFFLTIHISKFFSLNISKINYKVLSSTVLIFLLIITFIFSGFLGILVFMVSSFLGLFSILMQIKRTHLMGSLLIPTILLYLL
jgi:putative membrane protein